MSFLMPSMPQAPAPPPPPPPPPMLATGPVQAAGAAERAAAAAAGGKGVDNTLKTGAEGAPAPQTTGGKTLLGQ
jgi:hypothetical protein